MTDQAEGSLIEELLNEELQYGDEVSAKETEASEKPEVEAKKEEEQNEEETSQDTQKDMLVMNSEFVHQYGLPKTFIGKPVTELGKSYKELQGEFTRKAQKLSELEKSERFKERESIYAEKVKNLPDNIDEPEAYNQTLLKMVDEIATERAQEILASQQRTKDIEQEVISAVKRELPNVDLPTLIHQFREAKGEKLATLTRVYGEDPSILVDDLVMFYKANRPEPDVSKEVKKKLREVAQIQPQANLRKQKAAVEEGGSTLLSELLAEEEAYFLSNNPEYQMR